MEGTIDQEDPTQMDQD